VLRGGGSGGELDTWGSKGNRVARGEKYGRTERRGNESILWRGMAVTSSISQRKAISGGVRPGGRGRAIVGVDSLSCRGCTSLLCGVVYGRR